MDASNILAHHVSSGTKNVSTTCSPVEVVTVVAKSLVISVVVSAGAVESEVEVAFRDVVTSLLNVDALT